MYGNLLEFFTPAWLSNPTFFFSTKDIAEYMSNWSVTSMDCYCFVSYCVTVE